MSSAGLIQGYIQRIPNKTIRGSHRKAEILNVCARRKKILDNESYENVCSPRNCTQLQGYSPPELDFLLSMGYTFYIPHVPPRNGNRSKLV